MKLQEYHGTETVEPEVILKGEPLTGPSTGAIKPPGILLRLKISILLVISGVLLTAAGLVLTITLVGAFVGIPAMIGGMLLVLAGVLLPFSSRLFISGAFRR